MSVVLLATLFSLQDSHAARPSAVDVDLGTATSDQGQLRLSPLFATVGVADPVMVGSYTLPWAINFLIEDSVSLNAFTKIEWFRGERLSVSTTLKFFYLDGGDLDRDGLALSARIIPFRQRFNMAWNHRIDTTLEVGGAYSSIRGEHIGEGDTRVHGIAVAHSLHTGLMPRLRVSARTTAWLRGRLLLNHVPVTAEMDASISPSVDVKVQARANAGELSSRMSIAAGIHREWNRVVLLAGIGYGSWFMPAVQLPMGHNVLFGEANFYVQF